jgi:branched-subunit amino acid ABC-type transport system permease component
MILDLLPHLVNGLTLGLLFALIALGFMLILGLMEQINLAHGSRSAPISPMRSRRRACRCRRTC